MSASFTAFADEFCKLAAQPISRDDAEKSLKRLQTMQENRDAGAMGRSAMVGAALMPVAGTAGRMVAGTQRFLKPGATASLKNPVSALKAVNWKGLGRQLTSDAMMGGIGGGLTPLAREHVEQNVQREKLRDYIAQEEGKKRGKGLRQQILSSVGV